MYVRIQTVSKHCSNSPLLSTINAQYSQNKFRSVELISIYYYVQLKTKKKRKKEKRKEKKNMITARSVVIYTT